MLAAKRRRARHRGHTRYGRGARRMAMRAAWTIFFLVSGLGIGCGGSTESTGTGGSGAKGGGGGGPAGSGGASTGGVSSGGTSTGGASTGGSSGTGGGSGGFECATDKECQ